jgi:exodeoxyribonuclease-3
MKFLLGITLRKRQCVLNSLRGYYLITLFFVVSAYTIPAQPQKFTVLTYNILNGLEQQQTKKDQLVEWVKKVNPDLVAFQELNNFTQASLEEFASRYGHSYAVLLKEEGSPVGITSKYPIRDVRKVTQGMHHGMIYAKIQNYHVVVTHLAPSVKAFKKRQEEVRLVLAELSTISRQEKVLVLGDFNSFSARDSSLYNSIPDPSGNGMMKFDYEVTGAMETAGFVDVLRLKHATPVTSFPTKSYEAKNPNSQCRLDYVWASGTLSKKCLRVDVIKDETTDILSDHYPVLAEFY